MNNKSMVIVLVASAITTILGQNDICKQNLPPSKDIIKGCCHKPEFLISPYSTLPKKCGLETSSELSRDEKLESEHFRNPCTIDCILKEVGILNNNEINQTAVKAALEKSIKDSEYRTIFQKAFEVCAPKVKKDLAANKDQNSKCSTFASKVMGCVFSEAFINCPSSKIKQTNDVCKNATNYLKSCNYSHYIMQG